MLGRPVKLSASSSQNTQAPGNFEKHYAPHKPILKIFEQDAQENEDTDALIFCGDVESEFKSASARSFASRPLKTLLHSAANSTRRSTPSMPTKTSSVFLLVNWPTSFEDAGLDDRIRRAELSSSLRESVCLKPISGCQGHSQLCDSFLEGDKRLRLIFRQPLIIYV